MTGAENEIGDAGFDDWLDALENEDDGLYYLECPNKHGSLPPRLVCPACGSTELEERALPETGEIETVTITHVPTPSFEDDAPYATAIADFGPVSVTGQMVGIDPETDAVEPGLTVTPEVRTSKTTGDRVLAFRPR